MLTANPTTAHTIHPMPALPHHPRRPTTPTLAAAALLITAAATATAVTHYDLPTPTDIQHALTHTGALAPAIVFTAYLAGTLAALPGSALTTLTGLLLGATTGSAIAITAGTAGAAIAFTIARHAGHHHTQARLTPRLRQLDQLATDHTTATVITLRLLPVTPSNLFNYLAGLTNMRTRTFITATIISIIPGRIAYATAGSHLHQPLSPQFLTATATILALTAAGTTLHRRHRRRTLPTPDRANSPTPPQTPTKRDPE